jgi:hypothetical protein
MDAVREGTLALIDELDKGVDIELTIFGRTIPVGLRITPKDD